MAKTITLRCRHCKINGTAKRRETDPAEATVRESACPDCVEGGWALLKWFGKDGAEIRRLNERTRQMEYYGLMLAARR